MAETHVRLVHVSKRFAANSPAVDNVSLAILKGSFATLLGPSGCGKTTLLRLIAGLYDADAGDIYLGPQRVNSVPAHRRKIAMVFQDYALFPHMSVEENVGYGLKLTRVGKIETRRRVTDTLRLLGLEGFGQRMPGQLSGGQQQRVAIARSLVVNPELLLLDEPLSNLDAKLRLSIREEILSLQRRLGITTVYVTHDQQEALAMSDWIAVMDRGKVAQWGTPQEVYYHPATPFVADFIGSVNLVHATLLSTGNHRAHVRIADVQLDLPQNGSRLGDDASVLLSVRPETLRLTTADAAATTGWLRLPGTVRSRTFLGQLMRYTVQVGDQEWVVDQPDPTPADVFGGDVSVLLNPRRVHVISRAD